MAQVCPTPISISLKTTPSICETDGKVDLEHIEYKEDEVIHYSFHSYAIYSDASLSILLRPWQNSSTFTDLAAGTYYYAVRAFCDYSPSAIVSKPFTITNTTPKLSTTLKVKKHSSCGNGTIEATTTGGVLPYQFSLVSDLNSFEPIATDQYLRPKQFSPIFENLPSGAYYVRVYDACNKYTTQRISIDSNRISTVFSGISVALKNCDQFSLNLTPHTYVAQHVDANTRLIINYPNGVIDTVPYAASVELNQNNFNHNETNNKITVTILIDCGSFSTTYTFDPHPRGQFIMNSTYLTRCNYRKYTFTSNSGEPYYYSLDSGLTWIPNTSNLILELENDSSHHVMFAQCGDTSVFKPFQQKYDDFEVKISEGNSRTCNGYSSIKVDFKNTNYLYWEILSGPSTSTKKGTVSTGALSASYTIVNLPLGTYVLKFTDNCENEIIDSITIVNAYDQLVFDYNIRFECSDNNIELYDLPTYTTSFGYRILDSEGKVVISGTLSGKYIINSQKIVEDALYSIEVWPTAYPCSVIEKTFVRPVNYNNLDLTNYVSFPSCQEENNTGSIIVQPQGGYPPYVYDLFEDTLLIHKKS